MSQQNDDVVSEVVDAFNRQHWVAWASNWHPDAELYDPLEVPGSGVLGATIRGTVWRRRIVVTER